MSNLDFKFTMSMYCSYLSKRIPRWLKFLLKQKFNLYYTKYFALILSGNNECRLEFEHSSRVSLWSLFVYSITSLSVLLITCILQSTNTVYTYCYVTNNKWALLYYYIRSYGLAKVVQKYVMYHIYVPYMYI